MANNEIEAVTSNEVLNKKELVELEKLENQFRKGAESFLMMGKALAEIKEKELYLSYKTFERYCEEKWDLHRMTGHRLIKAWETYSGLTEIGYKKQLPSTESQFRELSIVEDVTVQVEILDKLHDVHPDSPLTAKKIKEVVTAYHPPKDNNKGKGDSTETRKKKSKFSLSLPIDSVKIGVNGITFVDKDDPKIQGFISDLKQKLKEDGRIEFYYTPTVSKQNSKKVVTKKSKANPKKNKPKGTNITKEMRDRMLENLTKSKF